MKTIFDVATLAGVSKSTVSRVIRGNGSIKESTRRKVEKAMAELDYAPNQLAQGIRTGKTRTIALMVAESSNLYYNELLYHIEAIAREQDYMVLLCNPGTDITVASKYITWLRQRFVDGLIYCFYRESVVTDELYRLSAEKPVVFLDNPLESRSNLSCVGADGLEDTAEIVHYLKNRGAKRIAFVGLNDICNITYRYMGYRAGLTACGYALDPALSCFMTHDDTSHFVQGYNAAKQLMEGVKPPDAIISATDMLAIGVLRYLNEKGYAVPEQVSVVGYDDIPLSAMISPGLTTISQHIDKIAHEAMSILIHKIQRDNSYNKSVLLRSTLVKRGSA